MSIAFKTKADATAAAKAAKATLPSQKGWKIRVHENMGWHCSLIHGPVSIYIHSNYDKAGYYYSCLISNDIRESGYGKLWRGTPDRSASTPWKAFLDQAKHIAPYLQPLLEVQAYCEQLQAAEKEARAKAYRKKT